MATHVVNIKIEGSEFWYTNCSVRVKPRDRIRWKLHNPFPYGVVIKAPISPLDWSFKLAGRNLWITGIVRVKARPGRYPYGVGAYNGRALLFDDPEIIVELP